MARQNCFIKISGDSIKPEVLEWIKELCRKFFVVVCVGGGTQINTAFEERGLPVGKHPTPLGRETNTLEERQLARDILELNQAKMQDMLADLGVMITVIKPVLDLGTVLCHVNGDQLVLTAYLGFDILYIVTTPEREKQKARDFAQYPKIKVVSF